jgi:DNA-binding NarL/FixJ family response regulator
LERTRIVLVDMSPLLREIIREALVAEPDLEVVAEHEGPVDLRAVVEHDAADFVIFGADASDEGVQSIVAGNRGVRAIEVRSDGRESVLYELRPHRVPLGEISSEALVRTIRAAPGWGERAVTDETTERRTI